MKPLSDIATRLKQPSAKIDTSSEVQSSPTEASYNGLGILEVQQVIKTIENEGIACCVVGAKALRYYGVPRVSDWSVCVPSDQFEYVTSLFTTEPRCDTYEPADQIMPTVRSLLHTYPHLKRKDIKFSFFILPSWELFIEEFDSSKFEYSSLHIPYPKLDFFAQGLLDTQHWMELEQLIDGMNLDMGWAGVNIDFDRPGRIEYAEQKNERIRNSLSEFPNSSPSTLSVKPLDLRARFQRTVDNKEKRIDRFAPKGKFVTQYRKTGSEDPRLKEGRLC
ncbi:hypothetical protein GGR58DRAFT_508614 [Xylaria digitata]|nr:hypothetical protein GGR58DRAFT_508614 [Xylaria digitata]